MINRLFGTLCAIAIIAVVVVAVLNRGNYTSICFEDKAKADVAVTTPASEPILDDAVAPPSVTESDEVTDSLSLQPRV